MPYLLATALSVWFSRLIIICPHSLDGETVFWYIFQPWSEILQMFSASIVILCEGAPHIPLTSSGGDPASGGCGGSRYHTRFPATAGFQDQSLAFRVTHPYFSISYD